MRFCHIGKKKKQASLHFKMFRYLLILTSCHIHMTLRIYIEKYLISKFYKHFAFRAVEFQGESVVAVFQIEGAGGFA